MIDLSIIIVNWNTRDLLEQCLSSVYATTHDIPFEVFVVDNASSDGSVEIVRERFPEVQLIENEENLGFAKANNQAIRESKGRYILLLNSDTVVLSGAIERMIEFMDGHPEAGAVGAKLLNPDGSFQASYNDFPTPLSELVLLAGLSRVVYNPYYPSYPPDLSNERRECDWVGGACLMVRKEAIEEVGLLDENYFMYVEEVDWCYRLRKAGWKVYYLPEAQIVHWGGQSSRRERGKARRLLRKSELLFFKKHYGPLLATCLQIAICLFSLVRMGLWFAAYLASLGRWARAQREALDYGRTIWIKSW